MIVSYEGARTRGGLLLREVETEQEAFAEMRRFLEINNIPSNYTEVQWKEVNENYGILARHKHIAMGCEPGGGGADFGIYYEGQPAHLELGSEEKWGIKREQYPSQKNFSYYFKASENKYVCWYDEVAKYFQDLAVRKAGGG